MITFEEVYNEIGAYFASRLDKETPFELAKCIAESLEEQFQDFKIRLTVIREDDGFNLEMGLNSELLLPLLQEIRRLKMEVTSLETVWGNV